MASNHATLDSVWPALRSVATSIVPEAGRLDEQEWAEVRSLMEEALASRPDGLARRLRVFVRALHWLPLVTSGRSFGALDAPGRERVLQRVQDSRLSLVRRGFWGLRTLVLLGYYGRAAAAAEIGYRADARGWELRQ